MSKLRFSTQAETGELILTVILRKGIFRIPVKTVRCLQKEGRKLWIIHDGGAVSHYGKLAEVEAYLPQHFCRCHNSTVVNFRRVARLEGFFFHLATGEMLPVSQRKGPEVRRAYRAFLEREEGPVPLP